MKKVWFLVVLFMIFIGSGCATVYRYNYVEYDTPEKALSAQSLTNKEILDQITPTDTPINGSVIIIIPTESFISKEHVKVQGTPPKDKTNTDYKMRLNYVVTSVKNEMSAQADALVKRKLFNDAKIIESEKPEDADFSEDFAFYTAIGGWVLKKKSGTPIPIHFNFKLTPKERFMDWLGKIEKAAK